MSSTVGPMKEACAAQGKRVTTFIEVILNQELGEPFRRDAMKKPVVVAGIDRKDMRPQQGLSEDLPIRLQFAADRAQ
jgi:hypothetical protein